MNRGRTLVLALSLPLMALSTPLITQAAPRQLAVGMNFVEARRILLHSRWQPINIHANDDYEPMGVEHELFRRGYKEFDSCSIDVSSCILHYRRGSHCLTLYTIGEKVKYMKVQGWSNKCPEKS